MANVIQFLQNNEIEMEDVMNNFIKFIENDGGEYYDIYVAYGECVVDGGNILTYTDNDKLIRLFEDYIIKTYEDLNIGTINDDVDVIEITCLIERHTDFECWRSDYIINCDCCNRNIITEQTDFMILNECIPFCYDCVEVEESIQEEIVNEKINDVDSAIDGKMFDVEGFLLNEDFNKYDKDFVSSLHGENDTPQKALKMFMEENGYENDYDFTYIFVIKSSDMFTTVFNLYTK